MDEKVDGKTDRLKIMLRRILAIGFAFVMVRGIIEQVTREHASSWTVLLMCIFVAALALNELLTWVYIRWGRDL